MVFLSYVFGITLISVHTVIFLLSDNFAMKIIKFRPQLFAIMTQLFVITTQLFAITTQLFAVTTLLIAATKLRLCLLPQPVKRVHCVYRCNYMHVDDGLYNHSLDHDVQVGKSFCACVCGRWWVSPFRATV